MLGRIFDILSLGQAVAGARLTRGLVTDLAVLLMLAIAGAIVGGALVIGCLLMLHMALVAHGIDRLMAACITFVAALAVLAGIGAGLAYKVRTMRGLSSRAIPGEAVVSSALHAVVRGFYRGLGEAPPRRPR